MKIGLVKHIVTSTFALVVFIFITSVTACKKLVETNAPYTSLASDNVYQTDGTAISVLTGVYTSMANNSYRFVTGQNSLSFLCGLQSDELTLYAGASNSSTQLVRFYLNHLTATDDNYPWQGFYNCLLTVNTAIEKLETSTTLTPAVKQQLVGEAKFIRAFCYFYLVNLYGDIPLALISDYRVTSALSRSTKESVYNQIINDLKDAQNLLSESYVGASLLNSSTERDRPSKWAATALLSRVYLYTGDWSNAEAQATTIINNNSLFALSTINNAFLKASLGNKEAIWQLQPINTTWNTEDARSFVLNAKPGTSGKQVWLDTLLIKSFETGDLRRSNWVKDTVFSGTKYSYANKYKIATSNSSITAPSGITEYLMVLRLSEQYLIRAEARAKQNNLSGAIADLDKIRERASLPLIANIDPGISQSELIDAILHERQVELFTEWGHRWLDLKRTGKIDAVMSVVTPLKGGSWSSNWSLFPIPNADLQNNHNLSQNSGY